MFKKAKRRELRPRGFVEYSWALIQRPSVSEPENIEFKGSRGHRYSISVPSDPCDLGGRTVAGLPPDTANCAVKRIATIRSAREHDASLDLYVVRDDGADPLNYVLWVGMWPSDKARDDIARLTPGAWYDPSPDPDNDDWTTEERAMWAAEALFHGYVVSVRDTYGLSKGDRIEGASDGLLTQKRLDEIFLQALGASASWVEAPNDCVGVPFLTSSGYTLTAVAPIRPINPGYPRQDWPPHTAHKSVRPLGTWLCGDNFHGSLDKSLYMTVACEAGTKSYALWVSVPGSQADDDVTRLYPQAYLKLATLTDASSQTDRRQDQQAALALVYGFLVNQANVYGDFALGDGIDPPIGGIVGQSMFDKVFQKALRSCTP